MDLIGPEFDTVQILSKCTIIFHITKLSFYLHFAHTFILTQCILNIYEDLPASNIWKTISLIRFMPAFDLFMPIQAGILRLDKKTEWNYLLSLSRFTPVCSRF